MLGLAVIAAVGFILWLRGAEKAALPVLDGNVHLAGLKATVTVRRDGHGVPHIEAASEEDLWVAQGYVTAQDRLWQMDAFRRNANGELAEVMGRSLVIHDKWQRVLGIRRTAERIWANSPADQKARFEAYARGVNLYIAEHEDSLPAEFRLLGYKPRPWTGTDSISVGLMMVQTLDTHWETKLAREAIAAKLNNPKLEGDLYPVKSSTWASRARHRPSTRATRTMKMTARRRRTGVRGQGSGVKQQGSGVRRQGSKLTIWRRWPQTCADCGRQGWAAAPIAPMGRTTGSSRAATRPAESRCSRTICTWGWRSRTSGTWPT